MILVLMVKILCLHCDHGVGGTCFAVLAAKMVKTLCLHCDHGVGGTCFAVLAPKMVKTLCLHCDHGVGGTCFDFSLLYGVLALAFTHFSYGVGLSIYSFLLYGVEAFADLTND